VATRPTHALDPCFSRPGQRPLLLSPGPCDSLYHAVQVGVPALAGELGATYAVPIIYVPVLMITHLVAFYFLARPSGRQAAE
jgi:hypothetical protein